MKGWVYVITNKAMPSLIKVGYTMKDPELRAAELNHTGSPHPYIVEYEVLVEEPRDVEQTVHGRLRDRLEGKEWFRCSAEEAIAAIKSVVGSKAQVENFKRADRTKAEAIRQQKEAEERANRTAEEDRRKREAALDARRQEIISRYDQSLEAALPDTNFWAYFTGIFIVLIILLAILFPKMKDAGMFMLSTIGALVITPFVKDYFEDKAKESARYKSILAKREVELSAIDNQIKKLESAIVADRNHEIVINKNIRPTISAQASNEPKRTTQRNYGGEMKYICQYCGHTTVQDDSHIGKCGYCRKHGFV